MIDLDTVYTNFDGITYAKGASALKQLVAYVGEEQFLAGVRTYFRRHAFGNTTFDDLLDALTESSGRNLRPWAHAWLQTSGVNLLSVQSETDDEGRFTSVVVTQEPPTVPGGIDPVLRPHKMRLGLYDLDGEALERRAQVELELDGTEATVAELVGVARPDLLLLNDDDLTYGKVRLDARSMAAAVDGLAGLDDPLARSLIWGAAWDMTRDAELPTSEFVALVAAGIGAESDVGLVSQVLRQALNAVTQFGDPNQRSNYARTLATTLRAALEEAEPGSDHQLAFLRGLISFADAPEIAFMRGLLTGEESLPGSPSTPMSGGRW